MIQRAICVACNRAVNMNIMRGTGSLWLFVAQLCIGFVVAEVTSSDSTQTCPDVDGRPQYVDGTHCKPCPSCPPGKGLSEICSNGKGLYAICIPCPEGSFSDDNAVEMCRSCRICSNTMADTVPCTPTSDRKCGQCKCGYFRYEERQDQCASCADENSIHLYDECRLTCPPPSPSLEDPGAILTDDQSTPGSTTIKSLHSSLDPVFIVVIIIVLVLILVVAVVVLARKKYICQFCEKTPTIVVDNQSSLLTGEIERVERRTSFHEHDNEVQQGAIPFQDNSSDSNNSVTAETVLSENQPQGKETEQIPVVVDSTDALGDSSGTRSRNSGTQTDTEQLDQFLQETLRKEKLDQDLPKAVEQAAKDEAQREEFEKNLAKAIAATEDIQVGEMHAEDMRLLCKGLHEKPELLMNTSIKFNYCNLAELFEITPQDINLMSTAGQVLNFVAARTKEGLTVADLLRKLEQCGRCYNVVRDLVNQIIKRQREQPVKLNCEGHGYNVVEPQACKGDFKQPATSTHILRQKNQRDRRKTVAQERTNAQHYSHIGLVGNRTRATVVRGEHFMQKPPVSPIREFKGA